MCSYWAHSGTMAAGTGMGAGLQTQNEQSSLQKMWWLNIQKTKIMASGTITSWQIDGETVETVTDFILGAPK